LTVGGRLAGLLARLRAFVRSVADAEGGVLDAIPERQYAGRDAEAGDASRQEQEDAIAGVAERADDLADRHDS